MFRSCTLLSCSLILLSISSSGECRPRQAQELTLDVDTYRLQLVEALKMGILNSLGMDKEPEITRKVSEQELRKMSRLYREKVRELRGNFVRATKSMVLYPATACQPLLPPGQHMQWYRAVFQKNPNIQGGAIPTRAELKVSRQIPMQPTQSEARQRIEVQVVKAVNFTKWTHTDHHDVSPLQNVTMDITSKATKWIRTDDSSLVVDVQTTVGEGRPNISLELDLIQPGAIRRLPRSNREDECNEQGWCCRKSVNVSFKDIGWTDWIVAPTEYTMHLCDGACPHNYKPASMHTQVKSRLYQILKGGSPRPCCVPAAYEPMVIMYNDGRGKLKLTPFSDLIVTKCHCA
ncbi:inhibin beta C chain [Corythoichthys intestinalis]|uniref:inhibin beta C chain n=1 Tax=Corythoichthys intestinalis TaxID=161448 RepID=UPI0025A5FC6A|nr:inhibin beta C chain [Corythoichthys intestinalis]